MAGEKLASGTQVILLRDGKKASIGNLIYQFLSSQNISDISNSLLFHNIPEGKENKYIHRWIVFLSLLIQIFLDHISERLTKIGNKLERFLNRNIASDETSAGYFSFLGHLDSRLELDKEIEYGDSRYYPSLAMMASKLAYENESVIKDVISRYWKTHEDVDFYNFYNEFRERWSTQAFISSKKLADTDIVMVTFRGTSPFDAADWSTDFDLSWCKIEKMGKIHRGFMSALGLKKYYDEDDPLDDYTGYWPKDVEQDDEHPLAYYTIRKKLREIIENNKMAKFIITGHSLGGALAILFPAILAYHGQEDILDRIEGIYTYGQPRVGDEKFGQFMTQNLRKHNIKYYRMVYGNDIVATIPWDNKLLTFKHFGMSIHFNSLYHGKIVEEEKAVNKSENGDHMIMKILWILKYIALSMGDFILARLIAVWQLIRAFIISFTAGPDYKEGWLLVVSRLTGIICPCVIDHNPQDYVNATRLASPDLFLTYTSLMNK